MKLQIIALLGLFCLLILAACGPNTTAAPTAVETPSPQPTNTTAPTETPRPSDTPAPSPTTDPALAATATQPPAANPAAGGPAPDEYTYLGQDILDGTQLMPNRTTTITWTIKNTGTTGWTKDYIMRHFAGPKAAKDVYNFNKDVPVNDTINLIVTFTTPSEPGTYDMWFKLTNSAGQNFGDLNLVYTVSSSPARGTSTPSN